MDGGQRLRTLCGFLEAILLIELFIELPRRGLLGSWASNIPSSRKLGRWEAASGSRMVLSQHRADVVGQGARQAAQEAGQGAGQAVEEAGQAAQGASDAAGQAAGQAQDAATGAGQQAQDAAGQATEQGGGQDQQGEQEGGNQEEPRVTHAAAQKAEELGIDLSEIEGTGPDGSITIRDVRSATQQE
jgi:pyruvate/2-oxoglutarate dehydrogenase complex dihydrolipoamide acyltransferase (E2) component